MRRTEFWWGAAILLLGLAGLARGQEGTPTDKAAQLLARSGTIVLKVPDYDGARSRVLEAGLAQGAELMDAKTEVNGKGKKHGWLHLRLSADRMPALLPALASAGKLYSENVQTEDNISQYEELARRVERLQQHEGRLSGVLQSPRHMRGSDVLYLQERLFRASVDESLLSQQRLDLERSAQTSTILVELFEPGTMPVATTPGRVDLRQWFANAAALAGAGLNRQMARAATAGAYALVYAPLWGPALLIVLLLLAWMWRRRRAIWAWCVRGLTLAVTLAATALRWVRAAWDARHEQVTWPRPSDDEMRLHAARGGT